MNESEMRGGGGGGEEEEEEAPVFEIAVVVPKRDGDDSDSDDFAEILACEFQKMDLIVERVVGVQNEFLKLGATTKVLGMAAAKLQLKKRTHIGVDLHFQLDEIDAFIRQPDGSLFTWYERLRCYHHILYDTVKESKSVMKLKCGDKEVHWEMGESILRKLETEGVVKEVFPLHDDKLRKQLLKSWALNWWDFTKQPIDDICSYYGMKIAIYFTFLGMYTRWLLYPAAIGLVVHSIDFGWLQFYVLPAFFICLITWAVLFFQFWKRKNSALLARWQIDQTPGGGREHKASAPEWSPFQASSDGRKNFVPERITEKEAFQREEWFGRYMRYRNDFVIILSIICLQLPVELAYAHYYEMIASDLIKFGVTVVYLLFIQYLTNISGKIAVKLVNREASQNPESRADSLVYKVFGLYFMQSYVGLFYHALLHRNIMTLRRVLIQRLIFSEVLENLLENSIPYMKYSLKKFGVVRIKRKCSKGKFTGKFPRVEKEYLMPTYSASISKELEDGLFDDFLELALQFGMIMMFACALPLAFTFATLSNITEIRTDALKLLVMLRRPVPRHDATIGAWLNIFQFLIVMAICTNCALLACLYDREGEWNISPGLAAILIMEHALLLIKFGFSHFVPEEPRWVKAKRMEDANHAQNMCSRELLRTISGVKKAYNETDKNK